MLRTTIAIVGIGLLALRTPAADVRITTTATAVEFHDGEELITRYVYAGTVDLEKMPGTKPLAKPYFFPVNAPGGVGVTRPWPMVRGTPGETTDHFHQKSVWFCHGDVIPHGIKLTTRSADKRVHGVDFWAESPGHGRIVCVGVKLDGPRVVTTNEWRTPDGDTILTEERILRVTTTATGRLITLESDLHASVCDVTFADTKEGAMGVRVADEIMLQKPTGGTVTSSDGTTVKAPIKKDLPVWGRTADWHDYSGKVTGKPVGVAVFDAPTNPHRSAWHTRDYGLMAANPFGRKASGFPAMANRTDEVKLAKGEHLKLKYGVYVHTGDATTGGVADTYKSFVGR